MSGDDKTIGVWRDKIDRIDDGILDLLNERAECFQEIGRIKAESDAPVFVPSRELEIFERLEKRNRGPFPTSGVRTVFREVISASISVQRGVRVAFLGPPATYTHQAAIQQFGQLADFVPRDTSDDIFVFALQMIFVSM